MILDHWEMRSIRNGADGVCVCLGILDHWEMRSIRNSVLLSIDIARF